ncbi:unnamed protein product, partial [Brachionus calyciflorus]
ADIDMESADKILNKIKELSKNLVELSNYNGFDFLKQASDNIIDVTGNVLESFILFNSSNLLTNYKISNSILNDLVNISSRHLSLNLETKTRRKNIDFIISRQKGNNLKDKIIELNDGQIKLPSYNNSNILLLKSFSIPQIINGNSEHLKNSHMISLSYFDKDAQELKITNSNENYFEIKIKRTIESDVGFNYFNVSTFNLGNFTSMEKVVYIRTELDNLNSSLSFQLRPSNNESICYLVLIRFNEMPSFAKVLGDLFYILCDDDLLYDQKQLFFYFQIILNAEIIRKHMSFENKFVYFGIGELNENLYEEYCVNSTNLENRQLLSLNSSLQNISITDDFSYRFFSTGCFYLDLNLGEWVSDGMDVIKNETNIDLAKCRSTHLTDFAGGFLVLPSKINFSQVFSNSSFDKNPTIYITVIITCVTYLIAAVLCLYFDRLDKLKSKIYILKDRKLNWNYFYEINVFTGSRKNSGTKSNAYLNLFGENTHSKVRELKSENSNENKYLLKRSSVDTFIMSVEKPLGKLYMCRVFHDNSGKKQNEASWFLNHIIVTDLQTNEKYIFLCEKWLALDYDDGLICRNLNTAGDAELKNFNYLIKRQTKDNLSDGHLWFSILARPTLSSFTRMDRLTCCFVLLFITMLANILYYDVNDNEQKPSGLKIGPISITPQQIGIGIMTNLICLPASFILVQLFRRSKERKPRVDKLMQVIKSVKKKSNKIKDSEKKIKDKMKKKKKIEFPWWLAAISFLLVLIFRKAESFTNFDETIEIDLDIKFEEEGKQNKNDLIFEPDEIENNHNSKRETYSKEKKAKSVLREILCYCIFLGILFIVSYSNKDVNSFNYQNNLKKLFRVSTQSNGLDQVVRTSDIYSWIRNSFINGINAKDRNYLNDQVSYIIGNPIIRQLRVVKEKCKTLDNSKYCFHDYDFFNQDKNSYGLKWSLNISELKENEKNSYLLDSFSYKNSDKIETYPYFGKYSTYFGGGYVYILKDQSLVKTIEDLKTLEILEWIDSQTRVVLIEFSLFNVNLNLFAYCTIVFEVLPTGNILPSSRFEPVVLYEAENSTKYMILIFNVILIVFISFFMIKAILLIIKTKLEYFKKFWN